MTTQQEQQEQQEQDDQIRRTLAFISRTADALCRRCPELAQIRSTAEAVALCRTPAEALTIYACRVIPHDASDEQIVECGRAFMAGSEFMLNLFERLGEMEENSGRLVLEGVEKSLKDFVKTTTGTTGT